MGGVSLVVQTKFTMLRLYSVMMSATFVLEISTSAFLCFLVSSVCRIVENAHQSLLVNTVCKISLLLINRVNFVVQINFTMVWQNYAMTLPHFAVKINILAYLCSHVCHVSHTVWNARLLIYAVFALKITHWLMENVLNLPKLSNKMLFFALKITHWLMESVLNLPKLSKKML